MVTTYTEAPSKIYIEDDSKSIFIAGGITGCWDWQKDAATYLLKHSYFDYIFNPRRKNFDITDLEQTPIQIAWENDYLNLSTHILFWFTADTVQPITLFELGKWAHQPNKTIYVGCDPEYSRVLDVKTQLGLSRPDIKIWDTLDDMLEFIISDSKIS